MSVLRTPLVNVLRTMTQPVYPSAVELLRCQKDALHDCKIAFEIIQQNAIYFYNPSKFGFFVGLNSRKIYSYVKILKL